MPGTGRQSLRGLMGLPIVLCSVGAGELGTAAGGWTTAGRTADGCTAGGWARGRRLGSRGLISGWSNNFWPDNGWLGSGWLNNSWPDGGRLDSGWVTVGQTGAGMGVRSVIVYCLIVVQLSKCSLSNILSSCILLMQVKCLSLSLINSSTARVASISSTVLNQPPVLKSIMGG